MAAATSVCASVTSRSSIKTAKSRSLTQTTLLVSQFSDAKDIHAIRMALDPQRGREMQDRQVNTEFDELSPIGRAFDFRSGRGCEMTLGKVFAVLQHCAAVASSIIWTGQWTATICGWEGNRRPVINGRSLQTYM